MDECKAILRNLLAWIPKYPIQDIPECQDQSRFVKLDPFLNSSTRKRRPTGALENSLIVST